MKLRTKIHLFLSILLLSSILPSCFKKENYPIEPIIEYDTFRFDGDSAKISFNFTDGDGDLGLADSDTLPPFNPNSDYYYNLLITYYEKDDVLGWGVGKNLTGDDIIFTNRMKPIATKGKTKGLKGKFEINLGKTYYNPLSTNSDTIKYSIILIDRALHTSNSVESEVIIR